MSRVEVVEGLLMPVSVRAIGRELHARVLEFQTTFNAVVTPPVNHSSKLMSEDIPVVFNENEM